MIRRRLVARSILAVAVVALAVFLFIAGKGHSLYLDTNAIERPEGKLRAPELSQVFVDGKDCGEMGRAERVIAEAVGSSCVVRVEPLSGEGEALERKVRLPTGWTDLVISIPAIVAKADDSLVVSRYTPPPAAEGPVEKTVQQAESEVIPLSP